MLLSAQTSYGLKMTGTLANMKQAQKLLLIIIAIHYVVRAIVECVQYLLKLPRVHGQYILTECFSQDPLENFFGQLRSKGGYCQNPTAQACFDATQSLRVQGSLALQPVRGNCSRKRSLFKGREVIDSTPLPKRSKRSTR